MCIIVDQTLDLNFYKNKCFILGIAYIIKKEERERKRLAIIAGSLSNMAEGSFITVEDFFIQILL